MSNFPLNRHLGKMAPRPHEHSPSLHKLSFLSKTPVPVLDRSHLKPNVQMYHNDVIGDCTTAGLANTIHCIAALYGLDVPVLESAVVETYSTITGYTPSDPSSDTGAVETDVLNYCLRNGFPTEYYRFYPLWGSCNPLDRNALANIMYGLGVVYGGFLLSEADEYACQYGQVWDTEYTDNPGDPTPGTWGGHCALLWDYTGLSDTDTVSIVTWGATTQRATWRWLEKHMDESHAMAFRQLQNSDGKSFSGQDWDTLILENAPFLRQA